MKHNYIRLMEENPTVYGSMTNSLNQKIEFVEHPKYGDGGYVIAVCHELQLAQDTPFVFGLGEVAEPEAK